MDIPSFWIDLHVLYPRDRCLVYLSFLQYLHNRLQNHLLVSERMRVAKSEFGTCHKAPAL